MRIILKSLPGSYVFVQEYRSITGGPPPDLAGYFDDRADELINELVGIIFTQNMKSMEKYYRWLCKRYGGWWIPSSDIIIDTKKDNIWPPWPGR